MGFDDGLDRVLSMQVATARWEADQLLCWNRCNYLLSVSCEASQFEIKICQDEQEAWQWDDSAVMSSNVGGGQC